MCIRDSIKALKGVGDYTAAAIGSQRGMDNEVGEQRRIPVSYTHLEDRDSNTPYIKKVRVVTTVTYSLKD